MNNRSSDMNLMNAKIVGTNMDMGDIVEKESAFPKRGCRRQNEHYEGMTIASYGNEKLSGLGVIEPSAVTRTPMSHMFHAPIGRRQCTIHLRSVPVHQLFKLLSALKFLKVFIIVPANGKSSSLRLINRLSDLPTMLPHRPTWNGKNRMIDRDDAWQVIVHPKTLVVQRK